MANGFHHGGHPLFRRHAQSVAVVTDDAENIKPTKAKSNGRIDLIGRKPTDTARKIPCSTRPISSSSRALVPRLARLSFAISLPPSTRMFDQVPIGKPLEWPKSAAKAEWGDEISAILEPLEEPELTRMGFKVHLRGRVGQLRVLPEIEEALLSTSVGDERIVRVAFPHWWSIPPLRGVTKTILLRMLDVKRRGVAVR